MLFATICANMKSENFFILSQIQILSQIATSRTTEAFGSRSFRTRGRQLAIPLKS